MWDFLFHATPLVYLTQSVWRDEAFSILLSERSPIYFIPRLTFEPPLYYLLLHVWMKFFGADEIAARSLSLIGFALANIIVILWSEKLFKNHWLSWFLPIFFFLNPQLLYYAFEIRAYGWYMFFAVASMFAYWEKRWGLFILFTVLGVYTHTYMITVPAICLLHYLINNHKKVLTRKEFWRDPMIRSLGAIILLIAPWLTKIVLDFPRLRQSWYFPMDIALVKSVLGNVFIGYEGTPANLWKFTAWISIIFMALAVYSLQSSKERIRNSFFVLMVFVPLLVTIGISFIKPLFVNRYLIPVTIAQVFVVALAIDLVKHKTMQKILACIALLFVIGINIWYPNKHSKQDFRMILQQVNALAGPTDMILVDNPLILFETLYYSNARSNVFWFNPDKSPFPWYIGDIIFSPSQVIHELPLYPTRAFIIHTDGTFDVTYNTHISANTNKR